jgi:predicted transcriptional regulator
MFDKLDPILHSHLRLAVVSLLARVEEAEFVYIKDKLGVTAGNLSVQLEKLVDVKYIDIIKGYKGKRPQTKCKITENGIVAFKRYVHAIEQYFKIDNCNFKD